MVGSVSSVLVGRWWVVVNKVVFRLNNWDGMEGRVETSVGCGYRC